MKNFLNVIKFPVAILGTILHILVSGGFFFLVILLVYSFWKINVGSWIFILISTLFNTYVVICQFLLKLNPDRAIWSADEIEIIKKYPLFFKYSAASRLFSSVASGIYICGLILSVWLFINGFWIKGLFMVLNSLISMGMSAKLRPVYFLHDAVEKRNKHKYRKEMETLDQIVEKVLRNQEN